MAQPWEEVADQASAVSILNVGWVHLCANQMTAGIGNDVVLAPADLLAGVIPSWTAAFRGLGRLTPLPTGWLSGHRAPEPVGPAGN